MSVFKRRGIRRWVSVLLWLLAFFCWHLGLSGTRHLTATTDLIILQNAGNYTARDYNAMHSLEQTARTPTAFALWAQLDKQIFTTHTGRHTEVSLLVVRGDTRLVLPIPATLAVDDQAGCLIDANTACKLTGNRDATGATILYGGREYIVRGTFDSPTATAVLQADPHDTIPLGHVSAQPASNIDIFILRQRLSPTLTVSGKFYSTIACIPLLLAPAVIVILCYAQLIRLLQRWKAYPIRRALVWSMLSALTTGCFIVWLGLVPSAYLPTRWSDLGFWPRMWDSLATDAADYIAAARLRPDLLLLGWASSSLWGIGACPPLMAGYYFWPRQQAKRPPLQGIE